MKHKELLQLVVNALNSFNPEVQGSQEYIVEYIEGLQDVDCDDLGFVEEVFLGCIHYNMAIMVVIDGFYRQEGQRKTLLAGDKYLYGVLVYLILYRIDELGSAHCQKFIMSQNINKMHKLLTFFLDEEKLKTWIFSEWCKAYDLSYVQINLLSPVLRWLPELKETLSKLTDKVNNKQKTRVSRSPTAPKPFNLTKPAPRSVPIPEKIPKLRRHQPVPESTYKLPKEIDKLAFIKEQNRIKSEKQLIKSSMGQFDCANTEKTQKTKERMKKYIQEEEAKLKFDKPKAIAIPQSHKEENTRFRLNAAAIMREGLLVQRKEDEERKRLGELAIGGRDASEFLEWQNTLRRKDMEQKLADIETKRLAGRLSYEEAILARQALIEENKQKVTDVKKETKEMMDEYLKEKFKSEKEMRLLVEQIVEGHKNAKEAKVKLRKYKQSIVSEVNNKSKELMQKALEEAEEEMREKVALIAKIRAIESAPRIRFKYVDPTETSGIGLLGEMSVAELKERLNLLKVEEKKEEQRRRNEILQSKVEKDECLMETLESIAKHRAEKERASAKRLEEKSSPARTEIKDAKVQELQERLTARRAERERFRIQSSPPKLTDKQKQKKKDSFEDLHWKDIEKQREKSLKLHAESISRTSSRPKVVTR